jgi:hypothetical protein
MQCAYGNDGTKTCIPDKELTKIAKKLKIKGDNVYEKILEKIDGKTDIDVIEKFGLNKDEIMKPSVPGYYLSNTELDKMLTQFANKHKEFKSFGAVPYDFKDTPDGSWYANCKMISTFDPSSFKKKSWGVIVNCSESSESGSHWVCMYLIKKDNTIKLEYFDSVGTNECRSMVECDENNTPTEIRAFVDKVKKQSEDAGMTFEYSQNSNQHQTKFNECGMYCLYYIMNRLNGIEYSDAYDRIPDDRMTYLRKILYMSDGYCWKCGKFKDGKK